MMHGTQEYMETILRVPVKLTTAQEVREVRERDWTRVASGQWDPAPVQAGPFPDEPYHVVTGFQNPGGTGRGVWRLIFIFDPGPKEGTRLLTLFDETHGVMLFTVIVPEDSGRSIFKVVTPLQRAVQNQINGNHSGGLWAALAEDDENP